MLHGAMADGVVDLNAPLVFVGYGMTDAALGYDDYAGLDARGKIAVVLYGSPKGMDSEVGAHLQSQQSRVAAEHGAAATVAVETRATATAFPWEKVIEFLGAPLTTWVRKDEPLRSDVWTQSHRGRRPERCIVTFRGSARDAGPHSRPGGQTRRPAEGVCAAIDGRDRRFHESAPVLQS